jgi:hypothetical protein
MPVVWAATVKNLSACSWGSKLLRFGTRADWAVENDSRGGRESAMVVQIDVVAVGIATLLVVPDRCRRDVLQRSGCAVVAS